MNNSEILELFTFAKESGLTYQELESLLLERLEGLNATPERKQNILTLIQLYLQN